MCVQSRKWRGVGRNTLNPRFKYWFQTLVDRTCFISTEFYLMLQESVYQPLIVDGDFRRLCTTYKCFSIKKPVHSSRRKFALAADLYGLYRPLPLLLKGRPLWIGSRRRRWERKEKRKIERGKQGERERTLIRSSSFGSSGRDAKLCKLGKQLNIFVRHWSNKMV